MPETGAQTVKGAAEGGRPEVRLGGVGAQISAKIAELTGFETREVVLGHIQRYACAAPVPATTSPFCQWWLADLLRSCASHQVRHLRC